LIFNFLNKLFNEEPPPPPKKKPTKRRNTEGGKKTKAPIEKTVWCISGQDMPVDIHREYRKNWRYAFAKGRLIVRLPVIADKAVDMQILNDIKLSLEKRTELKPQLLEYYNTKTYNNGDSVTIGSRTYYLKIEIEDRKTHAAKLDKNKVINFSLGQGNTEGVVGQLLSRIVAKDYSAEFSRRVFELNHQFFKKDIKSINFKYNHSNWGSCSSSGNLNFSSRLLFAPEDVQDYVIIHELAHLIELNHSDRFWKLVADAMPNYAEKEKWLKKNSALCRF
jgi:predicted metal-dependent hydrolase